MAKIIYLQSNRWPAMTARIPIQSIHCRFRRDLQSNQSTVGTAERRPLLQWPHHSGKQCQCKLCRWISQLNAKIKLLPSNLSSGSSKAPYTDQSCRVRSTQSRSNTDQILSSLRTSTFSFYSNNKQCEVGQTAIMTPSPYKKQLE